MIQKQKLTKIGNSVGVIIPKNLRDLLGLDVGSEVILEPSIDKKSITLNTGAVSNRIDPEFFELIKSVDKNYSQALKKLASN